MTDYAMPARARTKPPARRCTYGQCAYLTRDRSQRCPDHRGRRRGSKCQHQTEAEMIRW